MLITLRGQEGGKIYQWGKGGGGEAQICGEWVKEKMFHWLHLIPLLCIYDTQMKISLIAGGNKTYFHYAL